jgi:hypothetical protein
VGILNPLNLLYAASIAILFAIYLRARSQPTVEVSSLMLFDEAPAPVQRVRYLRLDPLFWLETAALAALTLAIAGFYLMMPPAAGSGRTRALVFDLGAAMGAEDSGSTRLDTAKSEALDLVAGATPGDRFSVVGYALEARVYQTSTTDADAIINAIEELRPMAVGVRPAAVTAAMMRARNASEMNIFSDRWPPEAALAGLDPGTRVEMHLVGGNDDNLAIVSVDPGVPGASQGRAVLRNFAPRPRLLEFGIELGGESVYRAPLTLAPGEQLVVPFGPLTHGGLLEARIRTADALAADNVHFAYAPANVSTRVLVLSPDRGVRDDLARVLLAVNPNFVIQAADPAEFKSDPAAEPFDLEVVHDSAPGSLAGRSVLYIYPRDDSSPENVKIERSIAAVRMRARDGGVLALGPARVIDVPPWMDTVVSGSGGATEGAVALAAVGENAGRRVGVLSFDVRDHSLLDPDRLDALLATVDVVRRLTAPRQSRIVTTGAYVEVPASGAAKITAPDASVTSARADQWGRVRMRPLQSGRYAVQSDAATVEVLANYYDAAESNLTAKKADTDRAVRTAASAAGAREVSRANEPRPLAAWLIALVIAVIAVESAILLRHAARWGMSHV